MVVVELVVLSASMRPRPLGRGNAHQYIDCQLASMRCFNEAAAVGPRKLCGTWPKPWTTASFNEAAAVGPRKRCHARAAKRSLYRCFNEAAAVGPRKPGYTFTRDQGLKSVQLQ